MQKLKIFNTREIKRLREQITEEFGYFPESDYVYLQNEKDKIFLINKDLVRIDIKKLRVDKIGLYFAEIKNGNARLSKEGAQLLYKEAKNKLKNIVELDDKEMKDYFSGIDLNKELGEENRFVLLKYKEDVFGCAKYKENTIINFLPKIHRGEVIL